jgi:hypothetical protein
MGRASRITTRTSPSDVSCKFGASIVGDHGVYTGGVDASAGSLGECCGVVTADIVERRCQLKDDVAR